MVNIPACDRCSLYFLYFEYCSRAAVFRASLNPRHLIFIIYLGLDFPPLRAKPRLGGRAAKHLLRKEAEAQNRKVALARRLEVDVELRAVDLQKHPARPCSGRLHIRPMRYICVNVLFSQYISLYRRTYL